MIGLDASATGMQAQQLMIDVISHNLANTNTNAFKRQLIHFQDLMYVNKVAPGSILDDSGAALPRGIQLGLGVRTADVYRINTMGSFIDTGNALDCAISGEGYLIIDAGNGETGYTRDGALSLNSEGTIVTSEGRAVMPNISIPIGSRKILINKSGEVSVINAAGEEVQLGTLELARFVNEGGLLSRGDNMFFETASSGAPEVGSPGVGGYGEILQYYLEGSNVDPIRSITNLIRAQRAYEMNSKALQTCSEVEKTINDIRI